MWPGQSAACPGICRALATRARCALPHGHEVKELIFSKKGNSFIHSRLRYLTTDGEKELPDEDHTKIRCGAGGVVGG